MAARGAPTIANSAATKRPFSRISTVMMMNAVIACSCHAGLRLADDRPRPTVPPSDDLDFDLARRHDDDALPAPAPGRARSTK